MRKVRIAILSDLHFASSKEGEGETHIILDQQTIAKHNPYHDVVELISRSELRADIVLCPGDITFQADQGALKAAWAAIQDISSKLGAEHIFAATGNHDICSRDGSSAPEIWEYLKQLSPRYPSPSASEMQYLHYWAEHFSIFESDSFRVVSLNSCNCHSRGPAEWGNGRVTDYTISQIERELDKTKSKSLNILLCHHHPSKYEDINQHFPDYSEMKQGLKLLSVLRERDESWLVVHGHKHSPRISIASGQATDGVTVFSAGSFSAVLHPRYFPGATNQFYIIEFDLDYVDNNGVAGIVKAWDWRQGHGWSWASPDSKFESRIVGGTGFGHNCNVSKDASSIHSAFPGRDKISWSEVIKEHPWVEYISPKDVNRLLGRLNANHGLESFSEGKGIFPLELLRRAVV